MALRSVRYAGVAALGFLLSCGGDSPTGPSKPAVISLSTAAVAFVAQQGSANPAAQTIAITNFVTGPLSGLNLGTVAYGGGGSAWLQASLDRTVAPATLTLTPSTTRLAGGTYTATVAVNAVGASNSPQTVTVTLLVLNGSSSTTLAAAGQSAVFLSSPQFGTELTVDAGAEYLIGVVNTNPTSTSTADFTLAGAQVGGGAVARLAPITSQTSFRAQRAAAGAQRPALHLSGRAYAQVQAMQQLASRHLEMLALNRQVYSRLHAAGAARAPRLGPSARTTRLLAGAVSTSVGAVNKVYVRNKFSAGCADVDSIGARTVEVGQHIIVLADTNTTKWPNTQRPDSSFYHDFATEFDALTWPHLQTYIGDPLAYDANLSNVGKVTVTITPVLNGFGGGIVAFVNPCDFFPFQPTGVDPDFSNETEMFYSFTPGVMGFDVDSWKKELRATSAHEAKHLVAVADRIINGSNTLDEVWLEEGLAQESSDIWLRQFNGTSWKGDANFFSTVACEIDLGSGAPCDATNDKPMGLVLSHLPLLFTYLQRESDSHSEGLGKDLAGTYGAGWAMSRWATDQYATDEPTFIKSLVNEPSLTGLANLSSHTGQPIPLLLLYWNLAIGIDGTPTYTAADPRITVPSFDFANIFLVGQTELTCSGSPCGLFTQNGSPVYPIQPTSLSLGAFNHSITGVPGTSAVFFLLSGTSAGREALQLGSGSGGPISPSSGFRVGIIRVK